METRILIPDSLTLSTSSEGRNQFRVTRKDKGEEREKPTSSSGCEPDSDTSEKFSGDEREVSPNWSLSDRDSDCSVSGFIQKTEEDDDDGVDATVSSADASSSNTVSKRSNHGSSTKSVLKICANCVIEKGTVFNANEGSVRVQFLNGVSQVAPDDIRFVFGCFDRITDDPLQDDRRIRLCNWVRFVRRSKDKTDPEVNIVAYFSGRKPVFEVSKVILPDTELLAFFDIESISQEHSEPEEGVKTRSKVRGILGVVDGPLDLSKTPSVKASPIHLGQVDYVKPKAKPTLFSISSVLQPTKLFQPYSNHSSRDTNGISGSPPSTALPIFNTTSSSIGSSSPSTNNSPTLRPILRTRGRERSLLPCEVCGKAFDRPSLLKRHMRTHTGEKPHICDVCSKGFSTSSSLNTHRRIHSGEKPHQCPICGKRFTASSNLYYHRMTHNKEKPHKCLLCGKSFPTPGDLKSHQYVHSGSWPYNCPICHRGFSKQTNLRNHLLLHSGDKPHTCQVCGKKFALACNLRAHLRTHEEDPISSCTTCKRSFLTSLNMLVNGQCRPCILHQNVINTSSNKVSETSLSNLRNSPNVPSIPATVASQALALPALGGNSGNTGPIPGFHITPNASLFHNATALEGVPGTFPRPNPFLEQLFEWNYRFAKETAGNLGIMQQKLLESQMLAAQLMSVSNSSGIGVGISDILRLGPAFGSLDVGIGSKFVQQ